MENAGHASAPINTVLTMTSRPTIASAALVLVVGAVLAGCTAAAPPTPRPTLTPLSPEQEAFAAAEATYRAYITALNGVDLADAETFEPVYQWLSGDALTESQNSFQRLQERHVRVSGDTSTPVIRLKSMRESHVLLDVCLDVSQVDLTDSEGRSVVPKSRSDRQALEVELAPGSTATQLSIVRSDSTETPVCP